MKDEDRKKIDEVMAGMQCPRSFKCAETGFERLCKAKDIGLETYLECLEEDPPSCSFAFFFGYRHVCGCPLRLYLSKRLGK
jgi:hypothetical protein